VNPGFDDSARGALRTYARLLKFSARYWPLLLVAVVGMVIEAAAAGIFTWLMKPMVNETFVERSKDIRLALPLGIIVLFFVRGIATFVTDFGMALTGRGVVRDLRHALMGKYLRMPSYRFDAEPVPNLVSRLNYDTEQLAHAGAESLKVLFTDTLTIAVLFWVMVQQSHRVTATMLVLIPLIGLISRFVSRRYRHINRGIQDGVASMAMTAEQALAAQQEVKIYGAQDDEAARFAVLANRNRRLNVKVEVIRALASSTVQFLAAIALAAILYMAGREAIKGRMDAGEFVSLITAMMAMLPSLKRISNVQSSIQRGVAAAQRLFAVLDQGDESDTGVRHIERARGEIAFRNVGMRYAGQDVAALHAISFVARPGTVTAIVGRSGSGKSTLVRLIPRFYEPDSGEILLDGIPLRDIHLADLRRQIALVSQRVMLFDDSVAANIAYGEQVGASEAAIVQAAKAANALEFIERLPQGLQSRIGENGALLSGGQRQRLAMARAFLKDAPILILDEATAALDSESEQLVQDALNHLIPDRTTLVIAHRLATIEHADQVLVLDEGRLVEVGNHAQLLARDGLYARLHRIQFREAMDAMP
jgi:subfamily B ATP-binding cassette protein MsbA